MNANMYNLAPWSSAGYARTLPADAVEALIGADTGASNWYQIEQDMIDRFAALTGDRNFVHINPERAAQTAFGTTIAHGFLTMSLLATMAYEQCPGIEGTATTVNYGFDKLRFIRAVPAGSRVRGRFVLKSFHQKAPGRWRAVYSVTIEVEGQDGLALAAEWITAGV